jgi:hypothetical protein
MDPLARFNAYTHDFEKTYVDDDWGRLEAHFTEDAVYEVVGFPAFGGKAEGRDAVFVQLKGSLDRFDRRCASRRLRLLRPPEVDANTVTVHWAAVYTVPGAPDLRIEGTETVSYAGDRIRHLIATYASDVAAAFEGWHREHGDRLRS